MFPSKQRVAKIRASLLAWYRRHRRNLPWRKTSDPYRIWISEIMAQQTRIETVIPYYDRFIDRFPNVTSLARAKEESVLKLWEGLGYYSRARNLRATAKDLVENYGGQLPRRAEDLKKLKGFGPYTSASVASIAYGEPIACVDGNVRRVLSRLLTTHEPIEASAQALVDPKDPSSFNQGLMELGARICTPRNPKCPICPLAVHCQALEKDQVEAFPSRKAKAKLTLRTLGVFILRDGQKTLLLKRASEGLWGGLWELPTMDLPKTNATRARALHFLKTFGLRLPRLTKVGEFTHILSHQKLHVSVYEGTLKTPPSLKNAHWLTPTELKRRPLSRLQQKALTQAVDNSQK